MINKKFLQGMILVTCVGLMSACSTSEPEPVIEEPTVAVEDNNTSDETNAGGDDNFIVPDVGSGERVRYVTSDGVECPEPLSEYVPEVIGFLETNVYPNAKSTLEASPTLGYDEIVVPYFNSDILAKPWVQTFALGAKIDPCTMNFSNHDEFTGELIDDGGQKIANIAGIWLRDGIKTKRYELNAHGEAWWDSSWDYRMDNWAT